MNLCCNKFICHLNYENTHKNKHTCFWWVFPIKGNLLCMWDDMESSRDIIHIKIKF
jgi:hypothetical protein